MWLFIRNEKFFAWSSRLFKMTFKTQRENAFLNFF